MCYNKDSKKQNEKKEGECYMKKIWKITNNKCELVAYVMVPERCDIFDTSYASLQLVRQLHNDNSISGTQLVDSGEKIIKSLPIYNLD